MRIHRPFVRRDAAPPPGDAESRAARFDRAVRSLPQDPRLVVFESMMGTQYSDSPRALHREMIRQGVDATMVWSVDSDARHLPPGIATVARYSQAWYELLATAAIWIDNQGLPKSLAKPERVHYLQTWHGTPLKVLGWNTRTLSQLPVDRAEKAQRSFDRWDAVTVPSEYFVETVVDAFRSRAEILRCGLPRNDVLVRGLPADQRAGRLREIGLRDDAYTVLFAPTRVSDEESLGLRAVAEAIAGAGTQVLYRAHYLNAEGAAEFPPTIRDVSAVGDMADYLALADMLVTDYSSSMFDFCLTDRPIALFQTDQEAYAANRGVYFDVRSFSPGPIATTMADLVELVRTVDRWSDDWADQRMAYRAKFCEYESGSAAETMVSEHIVPKLQAIAAR
jgi:CDP-glycerol glycerophosphotransferase